MGQYFKLVNLDKREYVNPHKLGSGLKLWEQLANPMSVGKALIILLASMPEQRGGGDLEPHPLIGSWIGDKVMLVGDYAENEDYLDSPVPMSDVYGLCDEGEGNFKDISDDICKIIESELDGKFVGDGWRDFKYKDAKDEEWA